MVWVFFSYLVGSVLFGVVLGYLLKGYDIRREDLPGGSGSFRRLGPFWGVAVAVLDAAKGALVAYLALPRPELLPYMAAAVVAGHCWPVFFGFKGGGGIAPTVGFFLVYAPGPVLAAVALGLLVAAVYHLVYWRRVRRGVYPIPFGAIPAVPFLLYLLRDDPAGLQAALLAGLVMGARALQMLLFGR